MVELLIGAAPLRTPRLSTGLILWHFLVCFGALCISLVLIHSKNIHKRKRPYLFTLLPLMRRAALQGLHVAVAISSSGSCSAQQICNYFEVSSVVGIQSDGPTTTKVGRRACTAPKVALRGWPAGVDGGDRPSCLAGSR